jgi:hypothetical protein
MMRKIFSSIFRAENQGGVHLAIAARGGGANPIPYSEKGGGGETVPYAQTHWIPEKREGIFRLVYG